MACHDQMNLPNCATAEHLARSPQVQEERWRERLSGHKEDAVGDAHLYYGVYVCPDLAEWVAKELSREHALLKERRKASEEREAARKGKRTNDA
eukprot:507683-Pyramimonas_sp.AAC.1